MNEEVKALSEMPTHSACTNGPWNKCHRLMQCGAAMTAIAHEDFAAVEAGMHRGGVGAEPKRQACVVITSTSFTDRIDKDTRCMIATNAVQAHTGCIHPLLPRAIVTATSFYRRLSISSSDRRVSSRVGFCQRDALKLMLMIF